MFNGLFIFVVAAAGGTGSVLRLFIGRWKGSLPWGVLVANSIAAIIFGLWSAVPTPTPPGMSALILFGLCGGLSTFSAVVADAGDYVRGGKYLKATANLLANLLVPAGLYILSAWAFGLLIN